jgi:hypothetical protein
MALAWQVPKIAGSILQGSLQMGSSDLIAPAMSVAVVAGTIGAVATAGVGAVAGGAGLLGAGGAAAGGGAGGASGAGGSFMPGAAGGLMPGMASPIFRTMRPGFLPWFVNEEEARILAECIRAVLVVCAAMASRKSVDFWKLDDTYPMVTRAEGPEPQYNIEMFHVILPPEPPVVPVLLAKETLSEIHGQDYAVRGVMELDITYSGAAIGKKGERNTCATIAIAVDAESGMVLAPEVTDSSIPAGDTLAKVRVRSQKLKDSLAPLMKSFGVTVRVASRLPASDEARASLLGFLGGGRGDR